MGVTKKHESGWERDLWRSRETWPQGVVRFRLHCGVIHVVDLSWSAWWRDMLSDIDDMALNALSSSDCGYHGVLVV